MSPAKINEWLEQATRHRQNAVILIASGKAWNRDAARESIIKAQQLDNLAATAMETFLHETPTVKSIPFSWR